MSHNLAEHSTLHVKQLHVQMSKIQEQISNN